MELTNNFVKSGLVNEEKVQGKSQISRGGRVGLTTKAQRTQRFALTITRIQYKQLGLTHRYRIMSS